MMGYPAVKKVCRYVESFWYIPQCDGQTDG